MRGSADKITAKVGAVMGAGFSQRSKTEKLTVTALLAALFAVTALAFKGFVIIPSITELRPVNALPLIYGLLFGHLGAVASALGNLFGDAVGGTLTFASAGGMIGNFAMAYIPYKIWGALLCKADEDIFLLTGAKSYFWYFVLALLSAIPAAVRKLVFSMEGVRGKRLAALVLAANTFIAFGLSLFFFFSYSNEPGQLSILVPMGILATTMLLSMLK